MGILSAYNRQILLTSSSSHQFEVGLMGLWEEATRLEKIYFFPLSVDSQARRGFFDLRRHSVTWNEKMYC